MLTILLIICAVIFIRFVYKAVKKPKNKKEELEQQEAIRQLNNPVVRNNINQIVKQLFRNH